MDEFHPHKQEALKPQMPGTGSPRVKTSSFLTHHQCQQQQEASQRRHFSGLTVTSVDINKPKGLQRCVMNGHGWEQPQNGPLDAPSQPHAPVTFLMLASVWLWVPGGSAGRAGSPQDGEGEATALPWALLDTPSVWHSCGAPAQQVQSLCFNAQTHWLCWVHYCILNVHI